MSIIQAEHIMHTHPEHARVPHDATYENGSAFIQDHYCSIDEAAIPITDMGFPLSFHRVWLRVFFAPGAQEIHSASLRR